MVFREYDVVILGGGPGGYVASIRSCQLGLKTCLVETDKLGGICLNWGCIPTKALLRSAEVYDLVRNSADYGVKLGGEVGFDLSGIVSRSREVSSQLSRGVSYLLKKNGVEVVFGYGRIGGVRGEFRGIEVDGEGEIWGRNVILATGASPRNLPQFESDGKSVWNYKDALLPSELPSSLLVVGSGAIGMEFASFFSSLGSEVTVIESLGRVLPVEDDEVSSFVNKSFTSRGVDIFTSTKLLSIVRGSSGVEISWEFGGQRKSKKFDKVIMAVGIEGNVRDMGLENLEGVVLEGGHIVTDEYGYTGEKGIYAIGDVAGPPWLAHKAEHEGVLCVEHISGSKLVHGIDVNKIPSCTYCHPQVASVGFTEKVAIDKGYKVRVGRFNFMGNGKAIAMGGEAGFIKTVFDDTTGELLGAHMVGDGVTELIGSYVVGMSGELLDADFSRTVFPHPTLSEMLHESVLDAMGRVLHM